MLVQFEVDILFFCRMLSEYSLQSFSCQPQNYWKNLFLNCIFENSCKEQLQSLRSFQQNIWPLCLIIWKIHRTKRDITKFMNAFKSLRRHAQINLPPTQKNKSHSIKKKRRRKSISTISTSTNTIWNFKKLINSKKQKNSIPFCPFNVGL